MTGLAREVAPLAEDGPPHQFWWLHDARWYQGVARRFGQRAANEINAEALRFVARRVAAWCVRERNRPPADMPLAELLPLLARINYTMWPEEMVSVEHHPVEPGRDDGADEWETVVVNHFVPKMLRAARSTDGYQSVCIPVRAGFYEGLGLSVEDEHVECQFDGDEVCRFRTVRLPVREKVS
ncbi:hypothetical protein [Actinophytocola sp.]|uniref:hypothetical protein n=1 Tax=Actinophytocola sp. TaxID=1872138 RepID=UPI003D6B1F4E